MSMIKCQIMTFDKAIFSGEVISINAPGDLGYFGLLPGHAAMITKLAPGKIVVKLPDQSGQTFDIKSGVMEMKQNIASFLVSI